MEKELKTSGKMTWGFIWRFILYYIIISIILAVIMYFLLGKINNLVLSILSVITMAILIFIPTKLATSDIFKTKKLDTRNLRKFKRNIIIFYAIIMILVTFGNALTYGVSMILLENSKALSEQEIQNNTELTDDEKSSKIERQNTYLAEVVKVERETFIIITLIDVILFVFGVIAQFKFTNKYVNEED